MAALLIAEVFAELVQRGRLAPTPPEPLPGGNADRRAEAICPAWKAFTPAGRPVRLTVGASQAKRIARHAAFARACPALVAEPLFTLALPAAEVAAEEFFAGQSLEQAAQTGTVSPAEIQAAHARACSALAATEEASTEEARQAEWQSWSAALTRLNFWTESERRLLIGQILPHLYAQLAARPPVTRWTNGDFISANVLVAPGGDTRLIDPEFAARTHFFPEDAVRFHVLSPLARRHPEWFSRVQPMPGPSWHLYFWLRQLGLEARNNTAAYLAEILPGRLALIRRLAEQLLGREFAGWSLAAATVHAHLEEAAWVSLPGAAVKLSGWCHVPGAAALRSIGLFAGDRLVAEAPLDERPDVQEHFAGEPRARASGFTLTVPLADPLPQLLLCAQTDAGMLLPFQSVDPESLGGRGPSLGDYGRWAASHDPDPPAPAVIPPGPLFSILLPAYDTPPDFLRACLASVRGQHYPNWELCAVDDASPSAHVGPILGAAAAADNRIRIQRRATNGGIARATNDALAMARGEFIVLLDHDDVLRPHALLELAQRLDTEPQLDALYSDEDKITAEGQRTLPFVKPGFSPEFLLGVMYIGHALCVRTTVARQTGGFDPAYDGIQDYEFFLRITERTRRIGHIPRMLYHWRQSPGSSALHGNIKGDMDEKQAAAVRAHLARAGRTETVAPLSGHRLRLSATTAPSHAIVRPAAGEPACVALHNAARSSQTEVLVLLACAAKVPEGDWPRELAALAARPDSGCVAPLFVSAAGRVLSSGCTNVGHELVPVMRGFDATGDGYNGSLRCTREVGAVSPWCVAVRREAVLAHTEDTWEKFLGALRQAGLYHRVTPSVQLVLDSSPSPADAEMTPADAEDPFYNRHFDPRSADYRLRADHVAPAPLWHLDSPPPAAVSDGCLQWRGWCFWPGSSIADIRLHLDGELAWNATYGLTRPDVSQQHFGCPENCGFELRLRVPVGDHQLQGEAIDVAGRRHPLFSHRTKVRAWNRARYALLGQAGQLVPFQLLAGPSMRPAPVPAPDFPALSAPEPARPRLSIVTPSYQQAAYLEQCLRSVLDQPGVACDYVVQDGGSTDGSRAIIERFATRLHAWASTPDRGQADAIQRGFAQTAGAPDDVMAWLNSDDFYLPGTLAFVADFFARHPEVDVLYGHRVVVDEQGRQIGRWILPPHDPAVLHLNDFVPQETMFWRRRLWDRVGGINPGYRFAMDWDLLLRFQAAGARIVRVPHYLACFRVHPAQKTSAAMQSIGQAEIDALRTRANHRPIPPGELLHDARLTAYLRCSARMEWRGRLAP